MFSWQCRGENAFPAKIGPGVVSEAIHPTNMKRPGACKLREIAEVRPPRVEGQPPVRFPPAINCTPAPPRPAQVTIIVFIDS